MKVYQKAQKTRAFVSKCNFYGNFYKYMLRTNSLCDNNYILLQISNTGEVNHTNKNKNYSNEYFRNYAKH